ncbi:MAG: substrate-binding domain-containing protein [Victivallaceae bacterium]|jgi:DNA-binding LacI/PurR family transcriptional regulator
MIKGIRDAKRRRVSGAIRQQIMALRSGEALPPLRTMMQQTGCGRVVTERAISELENDGWLERRARQGIFRTDKLENSVNSTIIDIIACSEIGYLRPGEFLSNLAQKLLHKFTQCGCSGRTHRVKLNEPVEHYAELIEKYKIHNAVLIKPHNDVIIKIFDNACVRRVVLFPNAQPLNGAVLEDSPEMVPMQMEHLFAIGHRRIGYISADIPEEEIHPPIFQRRREAYYRMMAERGCRVRPEWVINLSYDEKELCRRLDGMFSISEPPTAIAVPDVMMAAVYQYFNRRKLRIGADISIIGFENYGIDKLRPEPTTIVNSTEIMADETWQLLHRVMSGENVEQTVYVPLSLHLGQSTASPKRNLQESALSINKQQKQIVSENEANRKFFRVNGQKTGLSIINNKG